tara:strand:+ start:3895 stop:4755 length:861 start_codon:yes stop_codon:yes gene_type:complete
MILIRFYLAICIFAFIIANDEPGYRFRGNISQDYYSDIETIMEMGAGSWTFAFNSNFKLSNHFNLKDELNKNIELVSTYTNVIATTKIDDKVKINNEIQKLNGTTVSYQINPFTGKYISKKQEIEGGMFGQFGDIDSLSAEDKMANILYPLGPDSIRYIGDTWFVEEEYLFSGDKVFTFEEFSGTMKVKNQFTLKKVKEKKGKLIAHIKIKCDHEVIGTAIHQTGDAVKMAQTISSTGNIKFNLNDGLVEYQKLSGSSISDIIFLEEDETMKMKMNMFTKLKQKIK